MEIEYNQVKNQKNIEERGLPFDLIKGFDLETALI
jgi:uncharacterized DUF497 family protein